MSAGSLVPLGRMQERVAFSTPDIFSLTIKPEAVPERLRAHVSFINQRLKLFLHIEQRKIKPELTLLEQIDAQLTEKFLELETLPEASLLIAHINFMKAYLIFMFGAPPDLDGLTAYCGAYALPHTDLYWYRAMANIILARHSNRFNNAMLHAWMELLPHLQGVYKSGLFGEILRFLDLYSETFYVDAALLLRLETMVNDLPEARLVTFSALASTRRHRFVAHLMNHGPHAEFFNAHIADLSPALPKHDEPRTLVITRADSAMTFSGAVPLRLICNRYDLLRFISQLATLRQPEPIFSALGLTETENKLLHEHIFTELMARGFLSSEGMIVQRRIFADPRASPLSFAPAYIDVLFELFQAFTLPGKTISVTREEVEHSVQPMLEGFENLAKRRHFLGRYLPINALFLLRQSLLSVPRPYPIAEIAFPEAKLLRAVALIDDCLEYAARIKTILTAIATFDPSQHEQAFVAAGQVATALFESKKSLIVQIGTPVKKLDKKSEHAFYALIEFTEQGGVAYFRIVLFNGGPGLSMHRADMSLHPDEFADKSYGCYHPVASKLLALTADNQLFLQHYLYKAFSSAYTYCPDDEARFRALGENVYLGPKEGEAYTFSGYGAYTRTEAFREAMAEIYRAQLSENCTLHNLKMALKHALGMDQVEFGEFEDLILLGARDLLVRTLAAAPAPAAHATLSLGEGSGLVGFDDEDVAAYSAMVFAAPAAASAGSGAGLVLSGC